MSEFWIGLCYGFISEWRKFREYPVQPVREFFAPLIALNRLILREIKAMDREHTARHSQIRSKSGSA